MARHEGHFRTAGQEPLSVDDLLDLLTRGGASGEARQDAIACFLAGEDGWREAVKQLGGAFAAPAMELKDRKAD